MRQDASPGEVIIRRIEGFITCTLKTSQQKGKSSDIEARLAFDLIVHGQRAHVDCKRVVISSRKQGHGTHDSVLEPSCPILRIVSEMAISRQLRPVTIPLPLVLAPDEQESC